ncbi:hypothetical protein ACYOEI_23005, partial [Singulisphaera rosea]
RSSTAIPATSAANRRIRDSSSTVSVSDMGNRGKQPQEAPTQIGWREKGSVAGTEVRGRRQRDQPARIMPV